MKKILFVVIAFIIYQLPALAQQYRMKQTSEMMGMKTETVVYVKKMRKRTEAGATMGMPAPPVEIQQCDLQRTVKLNEKKKLYFIEAFQTGTNTENELVKTAANTKTPNKPRKGGTIYNYYNITDTGERKKINGFTARHIWTTRKMIPDANACMMKDSMIIKTDGWYIDLPEFDCPVSYNGSGLNGGMGKLDCMDRFVTKQTGKGKLGFPLTETTIMIMGGQRNEFTTNKETVEFSTAKLDSMLFEIPPGYTQTMNEEDLQDNMSMSDRMSQYNGTAGAKEDYTASMAVTDGPKPAGTIRIGVYSPKGEAELATGELQQFLAASLNKEGIQGIPVSDKQDATSKECDYLMNVEFTRIKQGSKVGGFLKAIKNADPSASSSYSMELQSSITRITDGSMHAQPQVSGKYEGKINDAAKKALEALAGQALKTL
jgi:hypothetical protein